MLELHDHDRCREIRIARPPANALDSETNSAITNAVVAAAAEGFGGVVISGQPGMFSAGLDVPALLKLDETGMETFWKSFVGLLETIARCPVPLVCAITGHSPAGGAVMSIFSDYRVAARGNFKIGLNEAAVGLPLPSIIFSALKRQLGARIAEQLAGPGMLVSPDDALACGLVDELAEPEQVIDTAISRLHLLLGVPEHSMLITRARARADLHALFDAFGEDDLSAIMDGWFDPRTQTALADMVARIGSKKKK